MSDFIRLQISLNFFKGKKKSAMPIIKYYPQYAVVIFIISDIPNYLIYDKIHRTTNRA